MLDLLAIRPPRCLLVNLDSGEELKCLMNPTELSERLQVNWNRVAVPGLSHWQAAGERSRREGFGALVRQGSGFGIAGGVLVVRRGRFRFR